MYVIIINRRFWNLSGQLKQILNFDLDDINYYARFEINTINQYEINGWSNVV